MMDQSPASVLRTGLTSQDLLHLLTAYGAAPTSAPSISDLTVPSPTPTQSVSAGSSLLAEALPATIPRPTSETNVTSLKLKYRRKLAIKQHEINVLRMALAMALQR